MRRGFIEVAGRHVHYRRAGAGPALVMLHGSPNSSLALAPMMDALSGAFDCIALDTPGNGGSDPLPGATPSTGDYAEALKGAVDALGLKRFNLYGFHTGAGTAAEFMLRHQGRVAGAVLDGVAAWTEEEKSGMLEGYLPPFEPRWDGSHLAWLWARFAEQAIFFPWHRPSAATRMDFDLHPPEALHQSVMEFLAAGDNYRKPYAAAFAGDGAARVRRLTTPTLVTAHPRDPIAHHLDRLDGVHPNVEIRKEAREDRGAIWSDIAGFLAARPGDPAPEVEGASQRGFAATSRGKLSWRGASQGKGRPLLLLHDAGGSSGAFSDCIGGVGLERPVIALDLPGHGESDPAEAPCRSVEHFADAVTDAIGAFGIDAPDAVGLNLGGQIAVELKRRGAVHEAGPIGAPVYTQAERRDWRARIAPDLSIRWDGAHLLAAWRYLRLAALFDPWFLGDRAHIFWGEPQLEPLRLHRQCVDLLKCGPRHGAALAAQLDFPTAARMKEAGVAKVFAASGDPLSSERRFDALRVQTPLSVERLPAASADWGAHFAKVGR